MFVARLDPNSNYLPRDRDDVMTTTQSTSPRSFGIRLKDAPKRQFATKCNTGDEIAMPLTAHDARRAQPREARYKLSDSHGLYLQVEPNGSKYWRLKYSFAGKQKTLSFGVYPHVTLVQARKRQRDARRLLSEFIDPSEHKRQLKRAAIAACLHTFEAIGRDWFAKFSPGWVAGHSSTVLRRLEVDVFPFLGHRPVASIEADELLEVLRRVERRGAIATAHRCLQYCQSIFRYAIATCRAKRNPIPDLRGALAPVRHKHFASITDPQGVAGLLRAIDGYQGAFVTRCALQLAPLIFVRPGELRKAEWVDVNLVAAEWRIPAEQTKMRNALIVPLSRQAIEILSALKARTGHRQHLFPNVRRPTKAMSDSTINGALRRLGYTSNDMTAHGFRALARTMLDEVLEFRVEWIEHQLAHQVRDLNGRAYNRTAFLPQRKEMMRRWADYLDRLRSLSPADGAMAAERNPGIARRP